MDSSRELKRRRTSNDSEVLRCRSISPPPKRLASALKQHVGGPNIELNIVDKGNGPETLSRNKANTRSRRTVASPVQLNFIEELPAASNVNAVSLGSILSDPMIKECWLFNYLFDMDFAMCDYPHWRKASSC